MESPKAVPPDASHDSAGGTGCAVALGTPVDARRVVASRRAGRNAERITYSKRRFQVQRLERRRSGADPREQKRGQGNTVRSPDETR